MSVERIFSVRFSKHLSKSEATAACDFSSFYFAVTLFSRLSEEEHIKESHKRYDSCFILM